MSKFVKIWNNLMESLKIKDDTYIPKKIVQENLESAFKLHLAKNSEQVFPIFEAGYIPSNESKELILSSFFKNYWLTTWGSNDGEYQTEYGDYHLMVLKAAKISDEEIIQYALKNPENIPNESICDILRETDFYSYTNIMVNEEIPSIPLLENKEENPSHLNAQLLTVFKKENISHLNSQLWNLFNITNAQHPKYLLKDKELQLEKIKGNKVKITNPRIIEILKNGITKYNENAYEHYLCFDLKKRERQMFFPQVIKRVLENKKIDSQDMFFSLLENPKSMAANIALLILIKDGKNILSKIQVNDIHKLSEAFNAPSFLRILSPFFSTGKILGSEPELLNYYKEKALEIAKEETFLVKLAKETESVDIIKVVKGIQNSIDDIGKGTDVERERYVQQVMNHTSNILIGWLQMKDIDSNISTEDVLSPLQEIERNINHVKINDLEYNLKVIKNKPGLKA